MKTSKKILVAMLFWFLYKFLSSVIDLSIIALFSLPEEFPYVNWFAFPVGFFLSSLICSLVFKKKYNDWLSKCCKWIIIFVMIGAALCTLFLLAAPELSTVSLFAIVQYLLLAGAAQTCRYWIFDKQGRVVYDPSATPASQAVDVDYLFQFDAVLDRLAASSIAAPADGTQKAPEDSTIALADFQTRCNKILSNYLCVKPYAQGFISDFVSHRQAQENPFPNLHLGMLAYTFVLQASVLAICSFRQSSESSPDSSKIKKDMYNEIRMLTSHMLELGYITALEQKDYLLRASTQSVRAITHKELSPVEMNQNPLTPPAPSTEEPPLPVDNQEEAVPENPELKEVPQPPKTSKLKNHAPIIIIGVAAIVVIAVIAIIIGVASSNNADSLSAQIKALKEENAALQEELTAAQDNLATLKEEDLALDEQIVSLDEQLLDTYEIYDLHLEVCSVCSEMMDCRFCGSFDDYLYEKYIDHLDRH